MASIISSARPPILASPESSRPRVLPSLRPQNPRVPDFHCAGHQESHCASDRQEVFDESCPVSGITAARDTSAQLQRATRKGKAKEFVAVETLFNFPSIIVLSLWPCCVCDGLNIACSVQRFTPWPPTACAQALLYVGVGQ